MAVTEQFLESFNSDLQTLKKINVLPNHGQYEQKDLIYVVNKCKFEKIGKLEFGIVSDITACAQRDNAEVFICFADEPHKTCHTATDPLGVFQEMRPTSYVHRSARIAVTSGKPQLQSGE